jgi:hypothetical protein
MRVKPKRILADALLTVASAWAEAMLMVFGLATP